MVDPACNKPSAEGDDGSSDDDMPELGEASLYAYFDDKARAEEPVEYVGAPHGKGNIDGCFHSSNGNDEPRVITVPDAGASTLWQAFEQQQGCDESARATALSCLYDLYQRLFLSGRRVPGPRSVDHNVCPVCAGSRTPPRLPPAQLDEIPDVD